MENIHPIFERLLDRSDREERLGQRSKVLWLTGLSGSGKSTIAEAFEKFLFEKGYFAQVLDGDNIRSGINNNLGFSIEDRVENIRRISEIAKLYTQSGVITLNSFISPTADIRNMSRDIIGADDYILIYVQASLETCEQRDVKGLYKKARAGEIKGFTGIDSPFEIPEDPSIILDTEQHDLITCVHQLFEHIEPMIKLPENG